VAKLTREFDQAFERPGEKIPVGRNVVCDICDADYTDRRETGGFLFESKAVCPTCAPRFMDKVIEYKEEHFIRGRCTPGMAFADWVRELRGPDAYIRVTSA
jgi:hypothetical protein